MPRMGIGMPIVSETSEAAVLAVEDFVFLNDVSGELTPVDTSSRTNLLLQSQTFKTTWATNNAAIPNDLYKAPDDSLTAQAITATSAGASGVYVQQVVATTAGETYTYSAHVKAGANGFVLLLFFDGNLSRTAYFNTATGAASNTSDVLTTSFDKMDDGWFRVSITFQNTVTTSSSFVRIFPAAAAGSTATGAAFDAGTELLYIWGAQLEEDSRPTAYIVTTNAVVNAVTTELNDFSNVWDFDGTDIMLQVDPDSEGAFEEATQNLVLNHDYEELGSELVTNGDFSTETDWTFSNVGFSVGAVLFDNATDNIFQSFTDTVGETYELTITKTGAGVFRLRTGFSGSDATKVNIPESGVLYFTATSGTSRIQIYGDASNVSSTLNSVSVKQVDPNDRWVLGTGWSISDGKAVSDNSGSGSRNLRQNGISTSGNTYEITFKADVTSGIVYLIFGGTTAISSSGTYTFYKTATGADFQLRNSSGNFIGSIDNVTVKEYAITPLDV